MKIHTGLSLPTPQLAGLQAVWPWLTPQGHRRHVTTGGKFGSIRILSIVVFSCQTPRKASFCPLPVVSTVSVLFTITFLPLSLPG